MKWIELNTQKNINDLQNEFFKFHDSCITECSYTTGMFVDKDKNMEQDILRSSIKLIFQSQTCNSIEICFEDIKEVNIHTCDNDTYFNNISDVVFFIENDLIYWADSSEWNKEDCKEDNTYVICKKARYRFYDN